MAITIYAGLNGKGKTANATLKAVKKYKKDNSLIRRLIRRQRGNLVYSNYPILLDMKKRVYSHMLSLSDLEMKVKYPEHSMLIYDETQRYYDSREFKKFPKAIGTYLQHHRHASIDDVIFITQDPQRIDSKMRELAEVFRKYRIFITIGFGKWFFPYGFTYYSNYYRSDDYNKYHKIDKKISTYEVDNHFRFFKIKNIFPRYDSKYYRILFAELPNASSETWTGKAMTIEQLYRVDKGFVDELATPKKVTLTELEALIYDQKE